MGRFLFTVILAAPLCSCEMPPVQVTPAESPAPAGKQPPPPPLPAATEPAVAARPPEQPPPPPRLEDYRLTPSKLVRKRDEVDNVTWYRHPEGIKGYPGRRGDRGWADDFTMFEVYIVRAGDGPFRLKVQAMYGDTLRWLYLDSYTVVADDERFEHSAKFKRDVVMDSVWEIHDGDADLDMLRAVAKAKKAVARLRGERGSVDHTFNAQQRRMVEEMLTVFEGMSGKAQDR